MADKVKREMVMEALRKALEPRGEVYAMWEGGAAAFGRVDEWSDIDLQLDVADEAVGEVFTLVEQVLETLSPIELVYEIPQPSWHGHAQKFYRLRDASPFLIVDLAVMKHSSSNKFLEPEIHGQAVAWFDKAGVVQTQPLDAQEWAGKMKERRETMRVLFDLFQTLTLKEVRRGNDLEALAFYQGYTLRPLVEALRMRYSPWRYNFHTRYTHYEFPGEVVEKLKRLYYVHDLNDLAGKQQQAEGWFYEEMAQFEQ